MVADMKRKNIGRDGYQGKSITINNNFCGIVLSPDERYLIEILREAGSKSLFRYISLALDERDKQIEISHKHDLLEEGRNNPEAFPKFVPPIKGGSGFFSKQNLASAPGFKG